MVWFKTATCTVDWHDWYFCLLHCFSGKKFRNSLWIDVGDGISRIFLVTWLCHQHHFLITVLLARKFSSKLILASFCFFERKIQCERCFINICWNNISFVHWWIISKTISKENSKTINCFQGTKWQLISGTASPVVSKVNFQIAKVFRPDRWNVLTKKEYKNIIKTTRLYLFRPWNVFYRNWENDFQSICGSFCCWICWERSYKRTSF